MRNIVKEYLALMEKLVALINAGKGDEQEADDIRDKMDGPWYSLTDKEQKYVNGLTAKMKLKR